MPNISPRCSVNVATARLKPSTVQDRLATCRGPRGKRSVDVAADHQADDVARGAVGGPPPALRPSRSTTNRSATSVTSSMKCEM